MLFVFAGAAAEFALNRAVDWLFFTGSLPADPMARLLSTARFVKEIVFVEEAVARRTLERIRSIHQAVEDERGEQIPPWAHRDVLYLLIDYSERAYQLLHRPLTVQEKDDLYAVFWRVGSGLHIPELPRNYATWQQDRGRHLLRDLAYSDYTAELYARYQRQLGPWRLALLRQVQALLAPDRVARLLDLKAWPGSRHLIRVYRPLVRMGLRPLIRRLLLPRDYIEEVQQMDETATVPTR
uniref:ER-bound oxygenase mpaB/mpaB'/Rubber oxygenase catalytic domain-containing protein n=1 Tax=uncultured Armatimonadetes bacterium TaxID=157466 RepID=A0A6J4JZR3_9BACT|nr:hypothetical protein AVDCRST_MAG63-4375 [uncultured Armatimonadetes bacterium]